MKNQVQIAVEIATAAHAGQYRRDGVTPYCTHPQAVANKLSFESDEVRAAAWLHDVLEDTKVTIGGLQKAGIEKPVIEAVIALTNNGGRSYEQYLRDIKNNWIAKKVKVADMLHNLSDSPTEKQIVKYAKGLLILVT